MPDVSRFRRLPPVLPPMARDMESPTPSKKAPTPVKIIKEKPIIPTHRASIDKEKYDTLRYFLSKMFLH